MRTAALSLLLGSLSLAMPGAAATARPARLPKAIVRTFSPARSSRCDHPPASGLSYGYPIKPFDRQHPIRGNFGDPRTLTTENLGEDTPRTPGSFTFHNGVDISAATGTPVYPVVSGVAHIGYGDEVVVVTGDDRVFQYFHVRPAIRPGRRVIAGRTLLGRVLPKWLHVHLSEIDGIRVHNPADPGHLEPYRDHTVPSVDGLLFRAEDGHELDPQKLHGGLRIAADAEDRPPIPVPGEWLGFPVTPAFVAWRMTTATGKVVVREKTVADFRRREPGNRKFWRVYAAGTYQNFPVFAHHHFRREGRYLFNLTPRLLDTARLRDGDYLVTVDVADVCGNRGSLTERVRIRNGRR